MRADSAEGRRLARKVAKKGTGVAVLVIVDLEQPDEHFMHQQVRESETITNPHEHARALWRSVADDWPTCTHTVLSNDRADYLRWKALMDRLIGAQGNTYAAYVEAKTGAS